jgi:hypothetical protein
MPAIEPAVAAAKERIGASAEATRCGAQHAPVIRRPGEDVEVFADAECACTNRG